MSLIFLVLSFLILTSLVGYCAACVPVIFTPPNTAHHIYRKQLAYMEFFTPFSRSNDTPHGLYITSTSLLFDRHRWAAVVPLSHIRMTCHIAPRYVRIAPDTRLNSHNDLFAVTRHFLFNHYTNYYIFKLFEHWRKRILQPQA
jgi:hypothetical protein